MGHRHVLSHLVSQCSPVDGSDRLARDAEAVLRMVRLDDLMARTAGRAEVAIGLLDGPVDVSHSSLATSDIRAATGGSATACVRSADVACGHGTAVAGTLLAGRHTQMPGICRSACSSCSRSSTRQPRSRTRFPRPRLRSWRRLSWTRLRRVSAS